MCLSELAEEIQVFPKYWNHTEGLCHVCSWVVLQAWLAHFCARRQAGAPQLVCTGFKKAPLCKMGIFSSGTPGTKSFFLLSCLLLLGNGYTWTLLLFSTEEKGCVHPPVVLTDGISSSSAVGMAGLTQQPFPRCREGHPSSIRLMSAQSWVSSGFPCASGTTWGSGAMLSTLPLYSDFICEFLQIIDDWDLNCAGK